MSHIFPSATAEYAAGNATKNTVIAYVVTVLLSLYAIKTHLVTEAFIALMSLFFDKFTLHATSSISDLILFIMMSLTGYGAYFICRHKYEVLAVLIAISVATATMGV